MTTKHTPGPWRVDSEGGPEYITSEHLGPNGRVYVCAVEAADAPNRNRLTAPGAAAFANARLIAAAPDLLAALEAMLRGADPTFQPTVPRGERTVSLARAAIAKAKGEKS